MAEHPDTVQMIHARPYQEQGLISYNGEPEDAEEWYEAVADDYEIIDVEPTILLGWEPYAGVVVLHHLDAAYDELAYYLVPKTIMQSIQRDQERWS